MTDSAFPHIRIQWIDCAKAVAIIAVLTDHSNGLLYKNPIIAQASYFGVSLFILLAGITAWKPFNCGFSAAEGNVRLLTPMFKLRGLLVDYAIAVFLLQIWYTHFFDLKTYLTYLVNFSIQGPYYYLLFFLQLRLISPTLVFWCQVCNERKGKWAWQFATMAFLGWFSSILIRYTFVLPLHGGGKFILGGTYLLLYYMGIMLSSTEIFNRTRNQRVAILVVSGFAWGCWLWMMCNGTLMLDTYLAPYWGNGFNPPSAHFMIFALITLFLAYAGFSLLEESTVGKKIASGFSIIGRHTLYIFMYHLVVRDIIFSCFPNIKQNVWALRFGTFIPMLLLPIFAAIGAKYFFRYLKNPLSIKKQF